MLQAWGLADLGVYGSMSTEELQLPAIPDILSFLSQREKSETFGLPWFVLMAYTRTYHATTDPTTICHTIL